jgi:hypothetical protein
VVVRRKRQMPKKRNLPRRVIVRCSLRMYETMVESGKNEVHDATNYLIVENICSRVHVS